MSTYGVIRQAHSICYDAVSKATVFANHDIVPQDRSSEVGCWMNVVSFSGRKTSVPFVLSDFKRCLQVVGRGSDFVKVSLDVVSSDLSRPT